MSFATCRRIRASKEACVSRAQSFGECMRHVVIVVVVVVGQGFALTTRISPSVACLRLRRFFTKRCLVRFRNIFGIEPTQ